MSKTKVAIACQGGGSHTAFTAGAIKKILRETDNEYEIVGLSGTSGGAICALITWYGVVTKDRQRAIDLLDSFWEANSATSYEDYSLNLLTKWGGEMRKRGVTLPEVSPYDTPLSEWAINKLRDLIDEHVDFAEIESLDLSDEPALLISAVDVNTGDFEIFHGDEVSVDAVLASCAEPNLFRAVELNGVTYWDGLFSKNPPIEDFNRDNEVEDPDETWIIQINPQEREDTPKSLPGIMDRRNELAGNMSMNNEIRFMRRVNQWIDRGFLPDRYTHTEIKKIKNQRDLHWSTKLDRSPSFIRNMMGYGEQRAEEFLENQGVV